MAFMYPAAISSHPGVSICEWEWYNLFMKKCIYIICISLIIAMALGLCACGSKEKLLAKPTEPTVTVSRSKLISMMDESSGMWELVQRFFDDVIIYKTKLGTWTYAEVDDKLPKSSYNWDNLRHAGPIANTEWEYYEGSDLKSIKGIDISHYNKVTDWDAVKADGVEFVIIRCGYRGYSQGGLVEDKKFIEYARDAYAAGLKLGCYFVTQAVDTAEAVEEADYVLSLMKEAGVEFEYPVCLDLEDAASLEARTLNLSKDKRTDIIIAFCEEIKAAGRCPMLYSAIRWYMDEMDLTRLTEYDKWFAQYFNRPFFPYEFWIWQYTSSGVVDGIEGDVDLNICFKDYSN